MNESYQDYTRRFKDLAEQQSLYQMRCSSCTSAVGCWVRDNLFRSTDAERFYWDHDFFERDEESGVVRCLYKDKDLPTTEKEGTVAEESN